MVLLYGLSLFCNSIAFFRYFTFEKTFPFRIGEGVVIESLKLLAQIFNQLFFLLNWHIFITLSLELFYHLSLQIGLALIKCVAYHIGAFVV